MPKPTLKLLKQRQEKQEEWRREARRIIAGGFVGLGNLSFGGLLLAQGFSTNAFDPNAAVLGMGSTVLFYFMAMLILKGGD